MIDAYAIIDATWPAAEYRRAGGFLIRDGQGGGSRVSWPCALRNMFGYSTDFR